MREELEKSILKQLELLEQASNNADVDELCKLTSEIIKVVEAIEGVKHMDLENEIKIELQCIRSTMESRDNNDFKTDSDFFEYLSKCIIEYQAHMMRSTSKIKS